MFTLTGQMASFLPWRQNQPNGGRDENFVTVALKHFQDENKVNEINMQYILVYLSVVVLFPSL